MLCGCRDIRLSPSVGCRYDTLIFRQYYNEFVHIHIYQRNINPTVESNKRVIQLKACIILSHDLQGHRIPVDCHLTLASN